MAYASGAVRSVPQTGVGRAPVAGPALAVLDGTDLFEHPFVIEVKPSGELILSRVRERRNSKDSFLQAADITFDSDGNYRRITIEAGLQPRGDTLSRYAAVGEIYSYMRNHGSWNSYEVDLTPERTGSWEANVAEVPYGPEQQIVLKLRRTRAGYSVQEPPQAILARQTMRTWNPLTKCAPSAIATKFATSHRYI